ncbi:hypothetical protein BX666DRAFT_1855381 [Dichotomocladium elegans]|nr:hypothetical protein BX666DRAFT_1855381 [Dichotomocladium elegans]
MIVALEGGLTTAASKQQRSDDENDSGVHDELLSKRSKLLELIFSVLAASMRDHDINKQFFSSQVGYSTLENAMLLTGAVDANGIPRRTFGILFAFAIDDERAITIFQPQCVLEGTKPRQDQQQQQLRVKAEHFLQDITISVANPDIMTTILQLQKAVTFDTELSESVLFAIYALTRSNRRNQVKLNRCGLMMAALGRVLPEQADLLSSASQEQAILLNLVKKLMVMGLNHDELLYIFQEFNTSEDGKSLQVLNGPLGDSLIDLILDGVTRSRWPNFIQFDMTLNGYSCLEIPGLRDFPKQSSGYTLMAWFHIDHLDKNVPVMLVSFFDGDKTVFRLSINPTNKRLQVHQSGNKPVLEYDSFEFQIGYWYHISLVHQRSKLGTNLSTLSLFVNGVCLQQLRCPYLAQQSTDVRVVIGTPREHAVIPCTLIWDLGPIYLVQDVLEHDVLSLYFNLGARYRSLFQDNLRQFQTYEASTALFLNLRNMSKSFSRRDIDQSILASVMRGTATGSLPESKIAFALFSSGSVDDGRYTGLTMTGLSETARNLVFSNKTKVNMILNSAIPKIETSLMHPRTMGYLFGDPVVAYPFGVDESIWRIGGSAVPLILVERSETSAMLCKTVRFMCETIRYSWRNSEDMERSHGYEILAYLLKQKKELITVEILELLLVFIGKNTAHPEDSVIYNPFAYRYIILNFEIWKKVNIEVQQAHLDQFTLFLHTSNKRHFNTKRLQRFFIVKRMLLAFRMNIYSKSLAPHVINALKIVTLCSWNTESIRIIATFLASTVSPGPSIYFLKQNHPDSQQRSATIGSSNEDSDEAYGFVEDAKKRSQSSKTVQIRNVVLEMLHDILCYSDHKDLVNKFASTITNKWMLLFFEPNLHSLTVVLAARILARILIVQGQSYLTRFRQASEGFIILSRLLPNYWSLVQLHETLIILMMGLDVADYPLYSSFDPKHLDQCLRTERPKLLVPDILPIIISMWKEAASLAFEQSIRDPTDSVSKEITRSLDKFVHFFNDLYVNRPDFKDMCCRQEVLDALIGILYPPISRATVINPVEELGFGEGMLAMIMDGDGFTDDMVQMEDAGASIIRRGGTSALTTKTSPHTSRKMGAMITKLRTSSSSSLIPIDNGTVLSNESLHAILEFVVNISVQSIIDPQDRNSVGLFYVLTVRSEILFESFLMVHIAQNLKSTLQFEERLVMDPKIMANVARFCQLSADMVLQGRFTNGAEQTYDLLASVIECIHSSSISGRYKANNQIVVSLYRSFNRMILLKMSDLEQANMPIDPTVAFLDYCIHHQKLILSSKNTDMDFLRCFCYHLYRFLLVDDTTIKTDAANPLIRYIDIHYFLESDDIVSGFREMIEMDTASFFVWVESRKVELNQLFKEHIAKTWENVVVFENKYALDMLKEHHTRRIAKLRRLQKRETHEDELMRNYIIKTRAWSNSIQEAEMSRFTKARQDIDGQDNFITSEWTRLTTNIFRERGLWGPMPGKSECKWRLDYTEGPQRMRKKIQKISEARPEKYRPKHTSSSYISKAWMHSSIHSLQKPLIDLDDDMVSSPVTNNSDAVPVASPTSSSQEQDSPDEDRNQEEEPSYDEDKNHKVLRLLDYGDMVLDVYNVSQIAGLDAREGLLLLCKQNIYLIDNFFQRKDGEVVEIWDVPQEERDQYLILVARAAGMETEPKMDASGDLHTLRKWGNNDIKEVYKRRFLFRQVDVAIEIFFGDGRNALITIAKEERDELYSKLASRVSFFESSIESIIGAVGEKEMAANSSTFGGSFKLSSLFGSSTLTELTQQWERREITNFQYLMYLNAIAGRSYNDLTQYPVFPWILADYKSEELDLDNPKVFRDLKKPMGAQTKQRQLEFADRYRQWGETNNPEPAFHYGTHYSSAMIVCSFLIRLEPFTQHYLNLQGGTFDHADRLFDSVGKAWESASEKNMSDVRELIPEFFYLPEFLENVNKFDFGAKQGTGETIDAVLLPPWAHGDPKIFIQKHRDASIHFINALESDYVSENLCHWIDLIFGYKQQGPEAVSNLNVFHHVSYEGAVDLDAITDVVEKTATIGIINNFGQTPRQLFKKPHPSRMKSTGSHLQACFTPLQNHLDKLIQSIVPIRDIKRQVKDIGVYNERLGVTSCQQLFAPPDGSRYVEWGFSDNSLRLIQTDTGKLLRVFEAMHTGFISAACFADSRILVTGSTDSTVCMWKVKQDKSVDFRLAECLRGHSGVITCLTASRPYSVLVSGSDDKTAIVWDLNRMEYVRTLGGHEGTVEIVQVSDSTGDIITCTGNMIRVWSINGALYLSKVACPSSESILSCIFYENKHSNWYIDDLIITGHKRGIIKVNQASAFGLKT